MVYDGDDFSCCAIWNDSDDRFTGGSKEDIRGADRRARKEVRQVRAK
jgi:hypothetical protein